MCNKFGKSNNQLLIYYCKNKNANNLFWKRNSIAINEYHVFSQNVYREDTLSLFYTTM